ncbi:MAG: hypothetical protein ACR2QR_05015 [Woeseiaceae bacterium]
MMKDNRISRWALGAILAGAVIYIGGCSSSDSPLPSTPPPPPPPPGPAPVAYNGPGSVWDTDLRTDGTFQITRRPDLATAIDLTIDGTYVRSAAGFVVLTVDSASGPDAPSQGDTAWAVEAQGYALMLYTQGDSFIPMITSGVCPSTDFDGNWVIARKRVDADATEIDGDYFGSFAFDATTGQGSLPARHALSDGFPSAGAGTLEAGTCANGIMEVSDALMYLTDNGGAIVHTNLSDPDDASFIFALTQKAVTSVAALDADYAGILFDQSAAQGAQISPVSITCTNGLCSGAFVTDVANNTTSGTFTVDLFGTTNAPVTGFLTGTVTDEGGNSGNLACMIDEDVQGSGQRLLSCVGQAPGNNQRLFNLFFASS